MSDAFRELLKKVGSGPHTSKNLTRYEAEQALTMILNQGATPAQIGAFFIAHRIKRPTGEELAGFLDALDALGPRVEPISGHKPVVVLNHPYDGRSRTAPLAPLVSLILAAADQPVLMHGSERMPTKYGIPLVEVWRLLGVEWQGQSLGQIRQILGEGGVGFVYLPDHFPQATALNPYRDQLGKRPPLATAELLWCPYGGEARLFCGYVHPPTEGMMKSAFQLRAQHHFTSVKGLEGSCDLPRDRTAIIGVHHPHHPELDRLLLHASDYNLGGSEIPLSSPPLLQTQMQDLLVGKPSALAPAVIWNGGFYLWQSGCCQSLEQGVQKAREIIETGAAQASLQRLVQAFATQNVALRPNY
ncbi:anthranilate phosphoribosyltransferase family protein [Lyngbya confervoides]|uniref:Anthranilate phosphoribosyltransferase family protein n=1 Tax=Lyngbya confervoides BDU141951 TaxID=1574623 RepID=A0ABD4T1F9_9CYAN|nr:anthranilate phosphoribosyltransferase family protein [Lyngbya confervoides]MCM1982288.1 anthranilate phosphoribosyltransferase family protein [Lyngbya confervoides BDU141951]